MLLRPPARSGRPAGGAQEVRPEAAAVRGPDQSGPGAGPAAGQPHQGHATLMLGRPDPDPDPDPDLPLSVCPSVCLCARWRPGRWLMTLSWAPLPSSSPSRTSEPSAPVRINPIHTYSNMHTYIHPMHAHSRMSSGSDIDPRVLRGEMYAGSADRCALARARAVGRPIDDG